MSTIEDGLITFDNKERRDIERLLTQVPLSPNEKQLQEYLKLFYENHKLTMNKARAEIYNAIDAKINSRLDELQYDPRIEIIKREKRTFLKIEKLCDVLLTFVE